MDVGHNDALVILFVLHRCPPCVAERLGRQWRRVKHQVSEVSQ